jgi:hypothetical protein
MHDLHEEGATRQQIEHALVTLPYVRPRSLASFQSLNYYVAPCDDQGSQSAESSELSQVDLFVPLGL